MQSLPQFLIYALAQTALAVWRIIPALLGTAAFLALLAICEHAEKITIYLTR